MQENSIKVIIAKNIKSYMDAEAGEENVLRKLHHFRSLIKMEKGFLPPYISFSVSESLEPHNYLIKLNDRTADFGQAPTECLAVLGSDEELALVRGEMRYESFSGQPCRWVKPHHLTKWTHEPCIFSGMDIISLHLLELMRYCAYNLFDQTAFLSWKDHPGYVTFGKLLSPAYGQSSLMETLRALLKMKFSLNLRNEIYEGIREGLRTGLSTPASIAECARKWLIHELKHELFDTRSAAHVFYPDDTFIKRVESLQGEKFPTLFFIDEFQKILFMLGKAIFPVLVEEGVPILLLPPSIRQFVEDITYQIFPELYVCARGEIDLEKGDMLQERIRSMRPVHDETNIQSVEVFKWFKGRFEVFKKLKLANYPFYRLAPLRTSRYWLYIYRGISSLLDENEEAGLYFVEMAKTIKPHHYLPYHIAGEQLFLKGLEEKARGEFEQAHRESPFYPVFSRSL